MNCAEKFIKHSERVGARFAEQNAGMDKLYLPRLRRFSFSIRGNGCSAESMKARALTDISTYPSSDPYIHYELLICVFAVSTLDFACHDLGLASD